MPWVLAGGAVVLLPPATRVKPLKEVATAEPISVARPTEGGWRL